MPTRSEGSRRAYLTGICRRVGPLRLAGSLRLAPDMYGPRGGRGARSRTRAPRPRGRGGGGAGPARARIPALAWCGHRISASLTVAAAAGTWPVRPTRVTRRRNGSVLMRRQSYCGASFFSAPVRRRNGSVRRARDQREACAAVSPTRGGSGGSGRAAWASAHGTGPSRLGDGRARLPLGACSRPAATRTGSKPGRPAAACRLRLPARTPPRNRGSTRCPSRTRAAACRPRRGESPSRAASSAGARSLAIAVVSR